MKNLEDNCVPKEFLNMDVDDYGTFLEMRRKLMAEKIRKFYDDLK